MVKVALMIGPLMVLLKRNFKKIEIRKERTCMLLKFEMGIFSLIAATAQ